MDEEFKIDLTRSVTVSASVALEQEMWIKHMKENNSFNLSKFLRDMVKKLQELSREEGLEKALDEMYEKLGIEREEPSENK